MSQQSNTRRLDKLERTAAEVEAANKRSEIWVCWCDDARRADCPTRARCESAQKIITWPD